MQIKAGKPIVIEKGGVRMRTKKIAALLCCGLMGLSLPTVRAAEGGVGRTFVLSQTETTEKDIYSSAASVRGGLRIEGGSEGTSEEPRDYYFVDGTWVISGNGRYTVGMEENGVPQVETKIRILSTGGVTLLLDRLNISSESAAIEIPNTAGEVRLELRGRNEMGSSGKHAGIEKLNEARLVITSEAGDGYLDGSLYVRGSLGSAGIGGSENQAGKNITIAGGQITAIGGSDAAGIGGGKNGDGKNIVISGGNVTSTAKTEGASAIGGGNGGKTEEVSLRPSLNHKIHVKTGTDKNNAAEIPGSPFFESVSLVESVQGMKYFKSETQIISHGSFHDLTLLSRPSEGGSVRGAGRYEEGARVSVEASAKPDYHFVGWTEGGRKVSENERYSFVLNKSLVLVAEFERDMPSDYQKTTRNPFHSWTVRFNRKIRSEDVTSENFYVVDAKGTKITGVYPVLAENGIGVRMRNDKPWEEGKKYFLVIRKGVRGMETKPLKKDIVMKFQVIR